MPSTGNIFDVAPQQEQPTKAVNHADGTGVVANRKPSIDTNSDTRLISQNSNTGVSTASRKCSGEVVHDLSGRATGSQKQRIDAEMRMIFRSSTFTTLDPADDPRFA